MTKTRRNEHLENIRATEDAERAKEAGSNLDIRLRAPTSKMNRGQRLNKCMLGFRYACAKSLRVLRGQSTTELNTGGFFQNEHPLGAGAFEHARYYIRNLQWVNANASDGVHAPAVPLCVLAHLKNGKYVFLRGDVEIKSAEDDTTVATNPRWVLDHAHISFWISSSLFRLLNEAMTESEYAQYVLETRVVKRCTRNKAVRAIHDAQGNDQSKEKQTSRESKGRTARGRKKHLAPRFPGRDVVYGVAL